MLRKYDSGLFSIFLHGASRRGLTARKTPVFSYIEAISNMTMGRTLAKRSGCYS